jgi:glycosyltransferase involved in cell wall biosynthesis
MRLTVGVISRNGLPHLHRCLESLPALTLCAQAVEFVLVDSASSDGTLEVMLSFARTRPDTRVYTMRGRVNAAAARNVIVRDAPMGALFLVDGDVSVNPEFVTAALHELERGTCDVIFGQLPEILHDAQNRPVGRKSDLYHVHKRHYVHLIRGVVVLGTGVIKQRILYDEQQRRCEDFELGLRLMERFRILAIPLVMGTHHTVSYFSSIRIRQFYREAYMKPVGRILRMHMARPWRIWHLRDPLSGSVLGFLLQLLLLTAVLTGQSILIIATLVTIGLDVARFSLQRRLHEYAPIRVVSPWQIAHGVVCLERESPSYVTEQCYPRPAA